MQAPVELPHVPALPRLCATHIFAPVPKRPRHDCPFPEIPRVVRRALRPADRVQQEILIRGFARQESLLRWADKHTSSREAGQ